MFKYFKAYAESVEGESGECFMEVDGDNLITRQVLEFDGKLYWATPEEHADERHMFTDQPEVDEELDELEAIGSSKFAAVWERATRDASEIR